jgi:hypothetical protein
VPADGALQYGTPRKSPVPRGAAREAGTGRAVRPFGPPVVKRRARALRLRQTRDVSAANFCRGYQRRGAGRSDPWQRQWQHRSAGARRRVAHIALGKKRARGPPQLATVAPPRAALRYEPLRNWFRPAQCVLLAKQAPSPIGRTLRALPARQSQHPHRGGKEGVAQAEQVDFCSSWAGPAHRSSRQRYRRSCGDHQLAPPQRVGGTRAHGAPHPTPLPAPSTALPQPALAPARAVRPLLAPPSRAWGKSPAAARWGQGAGPSCRRLFKRSPRWLQLHLGWGALGPTLASVSGRRRPSRAAARAARPCRAPAPASTNLNPATAVGRVLLAVPQIYHQWRARLPQGRQQGDWCGVGGAAAGVQQQLGQVLLYAFDSDKLQGGRAGSELGACSVHQHACSDG